MNADTLTIKSLFQKDVRYVIPAFQRPYVWNQDDQWEPLWEDVRNTAERYLENLRAADDNQAKAEERTSPHFLGAIVLQQESTASADLETRKVIDGQQRMTTLQLLVDAAQEVVECLGFEKEAKRLARLVLNSDADCDEDMFKLWPTSVDRDAFRVAMRNGSATTSFEETSIVLAHDFFQLQVREWIQNTDDQSEQQERVHGLEAAILGLLVMVVIDLGTSDDAHVIFETMNARGTPLLASDLVKNFVLQTAKAKGHDSEALYSKWWEGFEVDWWREDVRQGRLVRPRVDVFLNYWLVMRTIGEVQSHEVFSTFREHASGESTELLEILADLDASGMAYKGLDSLTPSSREGRFIYRWTVMDAGVITPILLWLFAHSDMESHSKLEALVALESYLVRRMVCRMTTKDYNRLFLELLGRLQSAGPADAGAVVVGFLREQTADARVWPNDQSVRNALLNLPLYRLLTRSRLRMVLEAVEDALRTPKSEEDQVVRGKLTIEHVMPQKWHEHWPFESPTRELEQERDRLVHTIGNLTMVSKRLNPSLSNSEWCEKRRGLEEHSVLHLNRELLANDELDWHEGTIRARGETLAQMVCGIWPGGDAGTVSPAT